DGYLYVNGALVNSDPGSHPSRDAYNSLTGISLQPGDYDIVYLTNTRGGNGAAAHLQWLSPDSFYNQQVIPLERLQRNSDLPGNPTNLLFSDRTGDGITLHWTDTATNEVYYDVERSTDGVNFTGVGELMPVANPIYGGDASGTFRDTGLSPHTRYYYRVVARNFSGESGALRGLVVSGDPATPPPGLLVDYSGGFTDTGNLFTTYPARAVDNRLRLTDGNTFETSLALTNDP